MRIEEYIVRKLTERFNVPNYLNDWDGNQVAYFSGVNDSISCVKESIMEHYNDNLVGEEEISKFCIENKCDKCDTCEHSYYVYGEKRVCPNRYKDTCQPNYTSYEQTKPLRDKSRFGC